MRHPFRRETLTMRGYVTHDDTRTTLQDLRAYDRSVRARCEFEKRRDDVIIMADRRPLSPKWTRRDERSFLRPRRRCSRSSPDILVDRSPRRYLPTIFRRYLAMPVARASIQDARNATLPVVRNGQWIRPWKRPLADTRKELGRIFKRDNKESHTKLERDPN